MENSNEKSLIDFGANVEVSEIAPGPESEPGSATPYKEIPLELKRSQRLMEERDEFMSKPDNGELVARSADPASGPLVSGNTQTTVPVLTRRRVSPVDEARGDEPRIDERDPLQAQAGRAGG